MEPGSARRPPTVQPPLTPPGEQGDEGAEARGAPGPASHAGAGRMSSPDPGARPRWAPPTPGPPAGDATAHCPQEPNGRDRDRTKS